VRTIEGEPDLMRIADRLIARTPSWSHRSMPMGLAVDILKAPAEARHFDGFASVADLKADAETSFLRRVQDMPTLSVQTGCAVTDLLGDPNDATRIEGVQLEDGTCLRGRTVILAAGRSTRRACCNAMWTHEIWPRACRVPGTSDATSNIICSRP